MNKLPKVVGDFKSIKEWKIEELEDKVNYILDNLDVDGFLEDIKVGNRAEDDIELVYYDYLDGGIGSTFVFLSVDKDTDEEGNNIVLTAYGVATEYDGNVTYDGYISMGDEESLFRALYDTLLVNTEEFKNI